MNDIETIWEVFMAFLFCLGFFVAKCSLLPGQRERHDWAMFGGALAATLGVGILLLTMTGGLPAGEFFVFGVVGMVGLGFTLFAMAFLYDQLRTRRILARHREIENVHRRDP